MSRPFDEAGRPPVRDPWSPPTHLGSPWLRSGPSQVAAATLLGSVGIAAESQQVTGRWSATGALLAVAALIVGTVWIGRGRATRTAAIVAVVVVAATIGLRPFTGRLILLVIATSIGSAMAIVVRGPSDDERAAELSPCAVASLAAVQVSWFGLAPRWLTTSFLVLAVVALVTRRRHPRVLAAADRRFLRLSKGLGAIGGAVATLAVAGILLYLPMALGRLGRRLARRSASRGWQPYPLSLGEVTADARFPFSSAAPPQRRRRLLVSAGLGAIALLLLVGLVQVRSRPVTAAGHLLSASGEPESTAAAPGEEPARTLLALEFATPYSELPAYRGVPWADELQREQISGDNVHQPMFNVTNGVRSTLEPPACECKEATLWFTGGSAAFGEGQRDDHTIASDLVRLAAADGIRLHVRNLGRSGAMCFEEVDGLRALLAEEAAPDIVVTYDGWNDSLLHVAFDFAQAEGVTDLGPEDLMGRIYYLNAHPERFLASNIGPAAGAAAASQYLSCQDSVESLAATHGFARWAFLQPDALVSTTQLGGYEDLSGISAEAFLHSPFAEALDTMEQTIGDRTISLRPLFRDAPDPVFVGLVHQNERGAAAVASRIYRSVRADVLARAR